ncbi:MAG: GAF domain-containing protein, partial [Planctomycetota bacterium]
MRYDGTQEKEVSIEDRQSMPKLLILTGPQSGEIIDIKSETTLLSLDDHLNVHVDSPQIGAIKTKLTLQPDKQTYFLNPGANIAINGEALSKPQNLGHGDFICLGEIQILFDEDQQSPMSDTQSAHPAAPLEQKVKFTSHKTFTDADSIVTGMIQSKDQEWAKRRLASLFKVTNAIAQVTDASRLFEELVDIIFLEFLTERCLILLKDQDTGEIKIILSRNRSGKSLEKPQISKTILAEVIDKKSSVLTEDALKDVRFETHLSIAEHEIHSLMAVPLMSKNRVYGMIQLDTTNTSRAFKHGDLDMLAGIAMQASAALEKFELEKIKIEKEKMEKDLKLASEVQRFLLPSQIPKIPGWGIALKYQLSQHLGGDYYDFIDKGNGIWA